MDSGNGSTRKGYDKTVSLYVRIPPELKFLLMRYHSVRKLPSFSYAVQSLLETHPELARLAAELYTESQVRAGLTESSDR